VQLLNEILEGELLLGCGWCDFSAGVDDGGDVSFVDGDVLGWDLFVGVHGVCFFGDVDLDRERNLGEFYGVASVGIDGEGQVDAAYQDDVVVIYEVWGGDGLDDHDYQMAIDLFSWAVGLLTFSMAVSWVEGWKMIFLRAGK
jgi:hypothetical protein